MIAEHSIQEVRDRADLLTVVRKYVPDLKKRGANYGSCCPFHDEKTGSFTVNETKGIYKCFGCGAGGADAIKFVMDKENLDFVPAIKYLANWFNVELEETRNDEETEDVKVNRADYLKINAWAAKQYQKSLMNLQTGIAFGNEKKSPMEVLLGDRKFTQDSLIAFQLGYAPAGYRFLTPLLLEHGKFKPASDIGLVRTTNDTNFDMFRDRIMFPIHNERGEVIAFGGRRMDDNDKDSPKYLNSPDSLIYKKNQVLYGLYQAAASIRKLGFAIVVEGYTDVISYHQTGAPNSVAACGTAFTDGHATLLKKYTKHVVIMGDGDAAGRRANLKTVDILLGHGFKVDICDLPDGQDPDSFARTLEYKEEAEA